VGTLSRVGYRQLLEAGVRIFEYGGPMMHAKTTVADGRLCRVGYTNLNLAGLVTNWEIDLLAQDKAFGARMERMFEEDLDDAREVILESRGPGRNPRPRPESPATKVEQSAQRRAREAAPRALATATRLGRTAFEMTSREGLRRHERSVIAAVAGAALAAGLRRSALPEGIGVAAGRSAQPPGCNRTLARRPSCRGEAARILGPGAHGRRRTAVKLVSEVSARVWMLRRRASNRLRRRPPRLRTCWRPLTPDPGARPAG
jgi:hypothetical protein